MNSLLKIAVLLVVVAGTAASKYLCSIPEEGHLNCSGRGLSLPPPGLWPNVTVLDLSNNRITELPTNFLSGFSRLEDLDLSNNSLTMFKFGELANNTDLRTLKIQKNQIEAISPPPHGNKLLNLLRIFASDNAISHLDPDFLSFAPNILELDIKNNPLIVEPGHPVLNHPKLWSLEMSFGGTGLNVVDSRLLAGLLALEWLGLSSTRISSVDGAFVNNKNLSFVHLQGNFITQITPGTFHAEGRIWRLRLHENPLNGFEPAALLNAFEPYRALIDISYTPLACKSRYEDLLRMAKSKNIDIRAKCRGQSNCSFARPPLESTE